MRFHRYFLYWQAFLKDDGTKKTSFFTYKIPHENLPNPEYHFFNILIIKTFIKICREARRYSLAE